MRQLIELFNTNDLRYLLVEYDDTYSQANLVQLFDSIMFEFETLRGDNKYQEYFEQTDDSLYRGCFINAIYLTIEFLSLLQNEDAKELIIEFNIRQNGKHIEISNEKFNKKAIQQLEQIARSVESQMIIKAERERIEQQAQKPKQLNWEEQLVWIHTSLGVMPEYDCTVSRYVAYEKQINARIAAQKAAQKNGNRT